MKNKYPSFEFVFEIMKSGAKLLLHLTENIFYHPILSMKLSTKFITLLITGTVILISGCRTPVAIDPMTGQQQTAVYQSGYYYATIDADSDTVFRTAIRAMDRMGILRTGEIHADDHITIQGRQVGDKKILVRIRQIAPNKSEVRIRVGIVGNLPESQMIYAKIRDAL